MPTYVYRCQECGGVLERRQSFQERPLTQCEVCAGELRRVVQPVGIIFRGRGFYSTDSRSEANSRADGRGAAGGDAESPAASTESSESPEKGPSPPPSPPEGAKGKPNIPSSSSAPSSAGSSSNP